MSIVKPKNFSYIRGPKGDKGDRGEPGSGVTGVTGRITYNSATKIVGFNESGLATTAYVNSTINNIVSGAPVLLDTLNELSAAIGNNPNFITDVTASIATKLSLAGGILTGELILSANPTNSLAAATKQYVDDATNSIVISYNDLTDKPTLFSGSYNDLTNKPAIPTVSTAGASGNYNDLTNKPTTDAITEGTNLYFTIGRARSSISVSGNLNYDSSTGIISYTTPFIPTNINGLSDVDTITVTPNVGDLLAWNGTNWVPTKLVNTTVITPSVGDNLVWDGTNWVPGPSTASIISTASLSGGDY